MGWKQGNDPFTFDAGTGIDRKEAIGPIVQQGPNGQRYIIKLNIIEDVMGIRWVSGQAYQWAKLNFTTREFTSFAPASEADWNRGWQEGIYRTSRPVILPDGPSVDTEEGTEYLTDLARSFTNSDNEQRNLILAAVAVVIITAIVAINVK